MSSDKERIIGHVRFDGATPEQTAYGSHTDPFKAGLVVGVLYDVTAIDVHNSYTSIILQGIAGRFNSVCFGWLDELPLQEAMEAYRRNYA